MMFAKRAMSCVFAIALSIMFLISSANALSGPKTYNGKQYYAVSSLDTTEDTGNKVCAKAGLKCAGYTAYNTEVCKAFHPDAKVAQGVDGSKAGFYCNGAPQQGVCARETNTCDVCPACNVNADCDYQIKDFFREMYVECANDAASAPQTITIKPSFLGRIKLFLSNSASSLRSLFVQKVVMKTVQIGPYPGLWGCEFVQSPWPGVNKAHVNCNAPMAADNFCKLVLTSQYAKAEVCNDKGLIICSNPCNPPVKQVVPASCPFDNDRPRGKQAPPVSWC